MHTPQLNGAEVQHYSRQMVIPEIGCQGQLKLKQAAVLVVGLGGLGSPLAMYLAAAGVGRLGLIDDDVVESSNLQRQIIHGHSTLGHAKVASAERRLQDLNPHIRVTCHQERLTAHNARTLIAGYDIIADGCDNFGTRYLVNDACVLLEKPLVSASVARFTGQLAVFAAPGAPCYRCLFPAPPPAGSAPPCAEAGVLGVLPGIMGALQSNEVLKLILGLGEPLLGRLLLFDALRLEARTLQLTKDPACRCCGAAATGDLLADHACYGSACSSAPASAKSPAAPAAEITAQQLHARLRAAQQARSVGFALPAPTACPTTPTADPALRLLDVREPHEWQLGHIAGAELMPLGALATRLAELNPQEEIVVYCQSGKRAASACSALQEAGFRHVRSLRGGFAAWQREPLS